MTITAVKQQVKNPERVSIYVDGKYSFSLTLDELVAEKIKTGLNVDPADIKRWQKLSAESKLKYRALNWVLLRPHSERELRDYLRRKKVEPELAEVIISEFLRKKYLDDQAFAKWWIDTKRSSKKSSNRKLQLELRQKGVSSEIVSELLQDSSSQEELALSELIAKKRKISRYNNDPQKLTEYLIRQGFSYGQVKAALELQK